MPTRLPGPRDLLLLPVRAVRSVDTLLSLIPRLSVVVDEVEQLLRRVGGVISNVEDIQRQARGVIAEVAATQAAALAVVARTDGTVTAADMLIVRAAELTDQISPLLDRFQPTLDRLEPMLSELVSTTSPDEVRALVKLIDATPELVSKLNTDILPVLDTLGTVAPDLRDLLELSKQLYEILSSVPGFGKIKKKVEDEPISLDELRADEEPPSSPDRG